MGTLRFQCSCGRAIQTDEKNAGRKAKCPACGVVLVIPGVVQQISVKPSQEPPGDTGSESTPQHSLEVALARIGGRFTKGVKQKVREIVTSDERVLTIIVATKEPLEKNVQKGPFNVQKGAVTGLFVVTSRRVFHVSKILWQVAFDEIALDQITSAGFETGMVFGKILIRGHQNTLQIGLIPKQEAHALCDLINKALRDTKAAPTERADVAVQLSALADLKSQGVLGEEDWARAKDAILGKPPSRAEEVIAMLQNLHALYKQGVLSQAEFNMKKWDVLSRP